MDTIIMFSLIGRWIVWKVGKGTRVWDRRIPLGSPWRILQVPYEFN
jgi:hypothetical protein